MRFDIKYLILFNIVFLSLNTFASAIQKKTPPPASISKQVGNLQVQFDLIRVVQPNKIVNANNPPSWRAYFPSCPQGSHYISGVNPNLLPLDQGTYYAYCKCICFNQCGQLPGVTSTGGKAPLYTARVTCGTNVQGWHDSHLFSLGQPANYTPIPHQYFYCQNGSCHTNPLPAELGLSIPTGGYDNTISVNFEACTLANKNNQCAAPDISSIAKRTVF